MTDYKRITRRNEDGTTWVKCVWCDNVATCDYTKESCCQVLQDRLAELEDLIEQGLLVKLPCKVGDTAYAINPYCETPTIYEFQIVNFEIDLNGVYAHTNLFYLIKVEDIIPTKAEAEARLAELQGGDQ